MLPHHAALLSFEGPDRYASVGGLGTRVTALADALADAGVDAQLFFIGDPALPPVEERRDGFTLRRWAQWISAFHPANVYAGEAAKVDDYTASIPPFVVDEIVVPAAARGERVLIIAEEWQTARAAIALDWLLRARGLRDVVTLMWNANNTYGFERIDWEALRDAATITTVSKYMKFELAQTGVSALVIPNGIPPELLAGADPTRTAAVRKALSGQPLLVKVGRFDPDKNWLQAIDAAAELRSNGYDLQFVLRGNSSPYGSTVLSHARARGLRVVDVEYAGSDVAELARELASAKGDVLNLRAFLDEATLYALYAAADAVLANSGKEPFGLVGLEVMAAGGIAVCGATGEEYAEPFVNALVCDTGDGRELAGYLRVLVDDATIASRLRTNGRATAERYAWPNVLETLSRKIDYVEATAGFR